MHPPKFTTSIKQLVKTMANESTQKIANIVTEMMTFPYRSINQP